MIEEIIWMQTYVLPVMIILAPALAVWIWRKEIAEIDFSKVNWPWKDARLKTWGNSGMKKYYIYLITGIICFTVLLAVPNASAGVEGAPITYTIATLTLSNDNPSSGTVFNNGVTLQTGLYHNYPINVTYLVITFNYEAFITAANSGVWLYTVYWDNVARCSWHIETSGVVSTGISYPIYGVSCSVPTTAATIGNHNLRLTRSVLSGSPAAISHETVSYRIDRTDILKEETVDPPSLYILMLIIAGVLAFLGENRGDNHYRAIAGFIILIAGFVLFDELDTLNIGISFAIFFFLVHAWIAIYLMFPKTTKEKQGE